MVRVGSGEGLRRTPGRPVSHDADLCSSSIRNVAVCRESWDGLLADDRTALRDGEQVPGASAGGDPEGQQARWRQWTRTGLSATFIHNMKSRASSRAARSHSIPSTHKNRNHRSRSLPYERGVSGELSLAVSSLGYSTVGSTGLPAGSSTLNGSQGSPVSSSRPDSVRASAFTEPERPKNLQIRFVTLGGSFVDVTGLGEHLKNRWKCHGCKDTSWFPEEDYLFSIREKANNHAAACRVIPLT